LVEFASRIVSRCRRFLKRHFPSFPQAFLLRLRQAPFADVRLVLEQGDARFGDMVKERELILPPHGIWEAALVIRVLRQYFSSSVSEPHSVQ